jgi:hypothetical protein
MLRLGLADRAVARFELFLEDIEEQSAAVVPYRVVLRVPLEEGGDLLEGGVCEIAGFDLERGVSRYSTRDSVWYRSSNTPFRPLHSREICTARFACAPFLSRPHSCRPRRRRGERRAGQVSTSLHTLARTAFCVTYACHGNVLRQEPVPGKMIGQRRCWCWDGAQRSKVEGAALPMMAVPSHAHDLEFISLVAFHVIVNSA